MSSGVPPRSFMTSPTFAGMRPPRNPFWRIHSSLKILEESSRARDRPTRTHTGDQVRDATLGLSPYLRAGGPIVRLGVHRVVVLVRLERARDVACEAIRHLVRGLGRLRRYGARTNDHLGPVCAQKVALLLTLLVGHCADDAVTLDSSGHRKTDTGVPARWLDDGAPRSKETAPLGVFDHEQPDTVFDRTAGVQMLELRDDRRAQSPTDAREANEGRIADEAEDVWGDAHPVMLCRPGGWGLPLRFHEKVEAHDDEDHRNEVRLQRERDQVDLQKHVGDRHDREDTREKERCPPDGREEGNGDETSGEG